MVAVLVPTFQTFVLIGYYINALALQNPTYVSDLLFTDPVYVTIITVCLALQFLVCITYAWLHIVGHGWGLEAIFLLTACLGWIMLCARYLDEGGIYLSGLHTAGIVLFVVGCAAYFARMLVCMLYIAQTSSVQIVRHVYAVVGLLVLSAACWVAFVCCYYSSGGRISNSPAWLFEHPAFAAFAAAHAVFFTVDWEQEEEADGCGPDPAAVRMDDCIKQRSL